MKQFQTTRSRATLVAGLALLLSAALVAQSDRKSTAPPIAADSVRSHVRELADDAYEGRGAGYAGERKAAEYIARVFKQIGLEPMGDDRGYFQEFSFHAMHPIKPWEVLTSRNVIGRIEGSDPALKNEVVVIGAHYDGQGRTGQADPFRVMPEGGGAADEIWNSANDNAASVAAVLEIARALKGAGPTRRSILFIAFGAEEHGMAGSLHYVGHPIAPLTQHVAVVNLEKIGRAPEKPLNASGVATSDAWAGALKAVGDRTGTNVTPANPFAVPESDHYPFAASRVPAIMILVSSVPAHEPSDTADKIDANRVAAAASFVMQLASDLAERPDRPVYKPQPLLDVGLSVHLATPAEADARGVAAPYSGLKVTGVVAGLPAAVAGLRPGDLIVDFANYRFKRDDTLSALMSLHREVLEGKRGNTLPAKVIRGTASMDLVVTLR